LAYIRNVADPINLPPPWTQKERVWDFLRACANLPWAIVLGISFGFWFVVFLLGTTWLAEGLWHPSADSRLLAGGPAVTAVIAVLLMIAFTYFTMALRRRILSFLLAASAGLFIRLYPRERQVIGDSRIQ
jgi:hypothetical protein